MATKLAWRAAKIAHPDIISLMKERNLPVRAKLAKKENIRTNTENQAVRIAELVIIQTKQEKLVVKVVLLQNIKTKMVRVLVRTARPDNTKTKFQKMAVKHVRKVSIMTRMHGRVVKTVPLGDMVTRLEELHGTNASLVHRAGTNLLQDQHHAIRVGPYIRVIRGQATLTELQKKKAVIRTRLVFPLQMQCGKHRAGVGGVKAKEA